MSESSDIPRLRIVASAVRDDLDTVPRLSNLSRGSLNVRTTQLFPVRQQLDVTIYFLDADREIRFTGEVVWSNDKLGDMAVRIPSLVRNEEDVIGTYLLDRASLR